MATEPLNIYSFIALAIVVIFALIGGFLVNILNGIKQFMWPVSYCIKKSRPITKFIIPSLIGNIIMGCIARNVLQHTIIMKDYNSLMANKVRMICLSILLLRGGMHIELKNQGVVVLWILVAPIACELFAVTLISWLWLFDMPILLALAFGAINSATAPSILIPSVMKLQQQGFGISKGIPVTMIACATLNNVCIIILFGIFSALATTDWSTTKKPDPIYKTIYTIIYELAVGLASGIVMGLLCRFVRNFNLKVKCVVAVVLSLGFMFLYDNINMEQSKQIHSIALGYMLRQSYIWGTKKPQLLLNKFWKILKPFLFGSIGAAVILSKIKSGLVAKAFLLFLLTIPCRCIGSSLVPLRHRYTLKERFFLGLSLLPKATIQSAMGGYILGLAKTPQQKVFGDTFLTVTVLSIVVCAPLGAIFTVSIGPKLLQKTVEDIEVVKQIPSQQQLDKIDAVSDDLDSNGNHPRTLQTFLSQMILFNPDEDDDNVPFPLRKKEVKAQKQIEFFDQDQQPSLKRNKSQSINVRPKDLIKYQDNNLIPEKRRSLDAEENQLVLDKKQQKFEIEFQNQIKNFKEKTQKYDKAFINSPQLTEGDDISNKYAKPFKKYNPQEIEATELNSNSYQDIGSADEKTPGQQTVQMDIDTHTKDVKIMLKKEEL